MGEKPSQKYRAEDDPEMVKYWITKGPKTAAFLLVIPGCTVIGYGYGLLSSSPMPYSLIGLGSGLLVWGLVVALTK